MSADINVETYSAKLDFSTETFTIDSTSIKTYSTKPLLKVPSFTINDSNISDVVRISIITTIDKVINIDYSVENQPEFLYNLYVEKPSIQPYDFEYDFLDHVTIIKQQNVAKDLANDPNKTKNVPDLTDDRITKTVKSIGTSLKFGKIIANSIDNFLTILGINRTAIVISDIHGDFIKLFAAYFLQSISTNYLFEITDDKTLKISLPLLTGKLIINGDLMIGKNLKPGISPTEVYNKCQYSDQLIFILFNYYIAQVNTRYLRIIIGNHDYLILSPQIKTFVNMKYAQNCFRMNFPKYKKSVIFLSDYVYFDYGFTQTITIGTKNSTLNYYFIHGLVAPAMYNLNRLSYNISGSERFRTLKYVINILSNQSYKINSSLHGRSNRISELFIMPEISTYNLKDKNYTYRPIKQFDGIKYYPNDNAGETYYGTTYYLPLLNDIFTGIKDVFSNSFETIIFLGHAYSYSNFSDELFKWKQTRIPMVFRDKERTSLVNFNQKYAKDNIINRELVKIHNNGAKNIIGTDTGKSGEMKKIVGGIFNGKISFNDIIGWMIVILVIIVFIIIILEKINNLKENYLKNNNVVKS